MKRGPWRATVQEVAESQTQLSNGAHTPQALTEQPGYQAKQGLPAAPLQSQLLRKAVSFPTLRPLKSYLPEATPGSQ